MAPIDSPPKCRRVLRIRFKRYDLAFTICRKKFKRVNADISSDIPKCFTPVLAHKLFEVISLIAFNVAISVEKNGDLGEQSYAGRIINIMKSTENRDVKST